MKSLIVQMLIAIVRESHVVTFCSSHIYPNLWIIPLLSRSLTVDFILFSLFTLFYFSFLFSFLNFLFLEQLRLGFISHAVTSVTNWWRSHKTDHGTWENEVEGSGTKWRHTAWTTHAGLMTYSWLFRVGCTVASTDHV